MANGAVTSMSEREVLASSLQVNALLTATGGFLDGFTFFGHGHVFANSMTGNIVMLGNSILSADWAGAIHRTKPLIAFSFGIWFSQGLHLLAKRRPEVFDPYITVLFLEMALLLGGSFYPGGWSDTALIIAIAFAASMQVQTFREIRGRGYFSTFTTGNLRTLCESVFNWLFIARDSMATALVRTFAVVCSVFLLGTVGGALAFRHMGNLALLIAVALLGLVMHRLLRGRAGLETHGEWERKMAK